MMNEKDIFWEMLLNNKSWEEIVKKLGKKKACEILKDLVEKDEVIAIPGDTLKDIEIVIIEKDLIFHGKYPYKKEDLKKVIEITMKSKV